VVQDENDPLHRVIGRKPTQSLPWHINICRQRIRENGAEYSAFSSTGTKTFHEKMKFAYFYAGLHHRFPVDPTVRDYLTLSRAAEQLRKERKLDEAVAAYTALSREKGLTEFQVADALERAASCARAMRHHVHAMELARRIPVAAVQKSVVMENLLAQRKYRAVVQQFGQEDWDAWPFWQVGAGAYARGRAYAALGDGERAEADLRTALTFTPDRFVRLNIWLSMGENRERNLGDEEGALAAYENIVRSPTHRGNAVFYRGLQAAARLLRKRGRFDEALEVLHQAEVERLRGYWRGSMLLAVGDTLAAAGRKDEALAAYRSVLADESAPAFQRKTAAGKVEKLSERPADSRS